MCKASAKWCLPGAVLFAGLFCFTMPMLAQSQGAAASDSTSATAQSPNATQASSSAPAAASAAQPAKKVWTNDDLGDLRGEPLSTVGVKNQKPAKATPKNKATNDYQSKIAKLQEQLPPIDSQIADLQAAMSGQTVSTPRKYNGVKPDDWQAELTDLQKKRADIQSQIDALEDQARHSGAPTNTVP